MRGIIPPRNSKANWKWHQEKKTESVRRLSYLSIKVSEILKTEGIQVSKDHDLELEETIDNIDNPFNE